jgi:hypothetical protein
LGLSGRARACAGGLQAEQAIAGDELLAREKATAARIIH